MEVDFGTGFQMERGIRENPLFRCPPSRHCNFSREETSTFREKDKEGLTGRVGSDPCGSSDMVSPSISIIRGKGLIFEGIYEILGDKNMEVVRGILRYPHRAISLLMACPPGKWLKCERFYALWTLSWNVRGLGSRNKRRMVKDFLRSENPDVVMIQETKKEKCDRRFVGSVWTVRNKDWVALLACGGIRWDFDHLGFKKSA
ncbi:hypothetical protein CK203_031122 [Vitis vinifera]|uniref:Endonuclease/exonuclease/phosphatase domain-containing protein n=1 Tax=Vitis vinifera TaxID=29760 RepID=A0A438J0J4_VITVI|nr:hypothetical protein CK203_031122 [Vitis vinifera]